MILYQLHRLHGTSNGKWQDDELLNKRKDQIDRGNFKLLSKYLPKGTGKNHKKTPIRTSPDRVSIPWPHEYKVEVITTTAQRCSIKHWDTELNESMRKIRKEKATERGPSWGMLCGSMQYFIPLNYQSTDDLHRNSAVYMALYVPTFVLVRGLRFSWR
jgi:hypothetical protein